MSTELVLGLAGIAGTLIGAALGAFVTWKIQKEQRDHEERVRFHDKRLQVYADFLNESIVLESERMRGNELDKAPYLDAYKFVQFIATEPLRLQAATINATLLEMLRTTDEQALQDARSRMVRQRSLFIRGSRSELGIDKQLPE